MQRTLWLAIVLVLAARAAADEPKGEYQVHDLSLWILDSTASLANSRNVYPSAFPATVHSPRTVSASGDSRRSSPMGLMTFYGRPVANLDVDLRIKSGSFLAHWPTAESLPNRLRWSGGPGVELVDKLEDESELVFVDDEHWFRKAREGQTLYVRRGARAERFLTYDAELNLAAPIKLQGGPDKYTVINLSGATLYDVLISRSTPEGRRVAWIDVLPRPEAAKAAVPAAAAKPADLFGDGGPKPAKPPTGTNAAANDAKPAAPATGLFGVPGKAAPANEEKPKAAPAKDEKAAKPAAGLFGVPGKAASAAPAAPKKDAQAPADKAAPKEVPGAALAAQLAAKGFLPKGKADAAIAAAAGNAPAKAGAPAAVPAAAPPTTGVEVTLSAPLPVGSPEAVAITTGSLSERLARAGLAPNEVELFVGNYAALLFEGEAVVLACRLDQGTIDDKMPLSIFPEPTKVVRVPMVMMRNADPQLGGEVEKLIVQLGDPKFGVREAAQKQLLHLGPLAFPALNKVLNHADLEIAVRAERILLNQNQPALGRQGVATPAAAPAAGAPPGALVPGRAVNGGAAPAAPVAAPACQPRRNSNSARRPAPRRLASLECTPWRTVACRLIVCPPSSRTPCCVAAMRRRWPESICLFAAIATVPGKFA